MLSPSTAWVLRVFLDRQDFTTWLTGQRRNLSPVEWEQLLLDVADLQYVAGWHKAWMASDLGTSEPSPSEPAAPLPHEISVCAAAAVLQVSDRRVRQLLAAGDLDGRKDGWSWLVDRSSVELYRRDGAA